MAFFAIVLGAVMVWLDAGPGAGWLDGLGWYQSVKAEGAHQVLSTIAGSMITVAGVVFSIMIVAISYASSQYGPSSPHQLHQRPREQGHARDLHRHLPLLPLRASDDPGRGHRPHRNVHDDTKRGAPVGAFTSGGVQYF